jgi:hypothetical protein
MDTSEHRFFHLGMNMISGCHTAMRSYEKNEYNIRRFKELFGISPKVVYHIWRLLAENETLGQLYPVHLLWACFYMKSYGRDAQNASFANVSEKTFRKWVKLALEAMETLEENVVSILFHLLNI